MPVSQPFPPDPTASPKTGYPTNDYQKTVKRVLVITLLLNLLVMGIKLAIGLTSHSLSLVADGLHSLTDGANNVLGLFATRLASPLPDREHPYGHLKFEALATLGVAGFLGIACFEILQGAIERVLGLGQPIQISTTELLILLGVLGINIFVTGYEHREGRRVNSAFLIADAYHTLSDIWVTLVVLAGLLGVRFLGLQWLDVVLSFPVALMVFWSGWRVLRENLPWLVDAQAIDPQVIRDLAMSVPGVINVHAIASRGIVGRQCFVEMHLVVNAMDVETAHQIAEAVEVKLIEQFSPIRVITHIEPPRCQSEDLSF
ncbi:MAG: cation diffusion facilitator family transporter [Synechococcales bacterium]|nr:cation diffusion facilitator family transporter [Synechococcales bacterium]